MPPVVVGAVVPVSSAVSIMIAPVAIVAGLDNLILAVGVLDGNSVHIVITVIFVQEFGLIDLVVAHLAIHVGTDAVVLFANVRELGTIVALADVADLVVVNVNTFGAATGLEGASRRHVAGHAAASAAVIGFSFGKLSFVKVSEHGGLNQVHGDSRCSVKGSSHMILLLDTNSL